MAFSLFSYHLWKEGSRYGTGDSRTATAATAATLEWYDALAVAVALIALVFTFAVRIVQVDGSSMNPTLYDGQTAS